MNDHDFAADLARSAGRVLLEVRERGLRVAGVRVDIGAPLEDVEPRRRVRGRVEALAERRDRAGESAGSDSR